MRTRRVNAMIIAAMLVVPGITLPAAGAPLGVADVRARDTGGYVAATPSRLQSSTPTLVSPAMAVVVDANTVQWVLDRLATDLRLTVSGEQGATVFVGIALTNEVDAYLAGVAKDEIATRAGEPTHRRIPASNSTTPIPSAPG
jgi:hypothetical protein